MMKISTYFYGLSEPRQTRPECASHEAGFLRQMRPVRTPNEAENNTKRGRFGGATIRNHWPISACTMYLYVPKETGGLSWN